MPSKSIFKIFQYISKKMQHYTVYYIWKLLYIFRVVPPPNIRSAHNCTYSIWYLSDCYCYLPLSWKSCNSIWYLSDRYCYLPLSWKSSNSSTVAAGSSNGVTNTRCCRYSCMRSWWWVGVPPKTRRAVSRYNKLCNVASCWIYIGIFRTDPWSLNLFLIVYFLCKEVKIASVWCNMECRKWV